MSQKFERAVAQAFNKYFQQNNITGYAYRRRQAKYKPQTIDVLVDSPDIGYIGIECKSKKEKHGKRLNFKSDFSNPDNSEHQIPRTTKFLKKTGRDGALALQLRKGPGYPKEANIYQWSTISKMYGMEKEKSIHPKDLKSFRYNILREGSTYELTEVDTK